MNLDSFEKAFRDGAGFGFEGCEETHACLCGAEFNECSFITFEGVMYVIECKCWHARAERIMKFLDSHAQQIARYLNLEKERKTEEAARMPEVIPQ